MNTVYRLLGLLVDQLNPLILGMFNFKDFEKDPVETHIVSSTSYTCFFLQHLVLGIKFAVAYAIPDIPEWVEHEIAKMEFQRRQALKVNKLP